MWVFTTKGFVSVVAWRGCRKTVCVRARSLAHLQALFPGAEVVTLRDADYRHRARVTRDEFATMLLREAQAVQYDNFKDAIVDHAYHDACLDVWHAMRPLQEVRARAYGRAQRPLWPPEEGAADDEAQLPW